jgi:hypothetical protein
MIDLTLRIDQTSGDPVEHQVSATARDILMWERTTKGASLQKFLADPKMEDLYQVAYKCAWRLQIFRGTFEEFSELVDVDFDLDDLQDQAQEDPSPPTP